MLKLSSGFVFDYRNLYGEGRVTAADIDGIMPRVAAAHEAVRRMRATGAVRGHLSKDGRPEKVLFSQLPYIADGNLNSPRSIARLKEFGAQLRERADAVIHFGIGGSYLGNRVLFEAHCGEFWNSKTRAERAGYPKLYFSGNNIDPQRTADLIGQIVSQAKEQAGYRVTLIVVSKSGGTLDTMSNFMVVYHALREAGLDISVAAVTDPAEGTGATLLKKLAAENNWPAFAVPDGVGGRFSVFSEVGLITAACIGFDIDAFLDGARAMDGACLSPDLWANPALLSATLKYLAAVNRGYNIEIFMPYSDRLKAVADWYIQLLAESLGKRCDRSGREIFYGRTPVAAVGTTDMHAQTQQHQDGARDKIVQFVQIGSWETDPVIPDIFPAAPALHSIASLRMSEALDAALAANAEALSADGRPSAVLRLPRLDAFHLGELLYLLALSVAYEGELADVDAFDQPGVEAYKRIMGPKLDALKSR